MDEIENDYDVFDEVGDDMSEATSSRQRSSLRRELMENRVRSFYESIGQEAPEVIVHDDFELKDDHLYLKKDNGELVRLTTKPDHFKFLKKSTVRNKLSVSEQRRFDIEADQRTEAVAKLQNALPTDSRLQSIPLRDLSTTTDQIIQEIETSFITDEQTHPKTLLPMREIMGLNKSLQSIRGELANNVAKISELDAHIDREKLKLVEVEDDPRFGKEEKDRILNRLKDLQLERAARLEALSTNREQLRTQVSRIKETIQRILHEDTTLAERIKTLFREQGVTIASVLTALGFAISTLVFALTGSTATPPSVPSSDKNWIKKQLDHLKNLLKKIGIKALDAIPGILGGIISWLFSTASKVVGFMAEHLWMLLVMIVGLLFSKIKIN